MLHQCVSGGTAAPAGTAVLVALLGGGTAHTSGAARGAVAEGGEFGVIDCFGAATDRDY